MRLIRGSTSLFVVLAGALTLLLALSGPPGARAEATPGLIEIQGTTAASSTQFNLNEIGNPTQTVPGQNTKGWPLRKVLLFAQDKTGNAFEINSFDAEVEVSRPGSVGNLKVNQDQVAMKSFDGKLPIYFLNDQGETSLWQPGGQVWTFTDYDPEVFIPSSSPALKVKVSPSGPLKLKAGETRTFTVTVSNAGNADVNLVWSVDGPQKDSGAVAASGKFSFTFDKTGSYTVAVFAEASGRSPGSKSLAVTVGKAKETKPEKDKKDKDQNPPGDSSSGTYDPGYIPGYTDGTGGGISGGGSPSPSVPPVSPVKPDRKKQPQTPAGSEGQTVTGQLIDPNATATVTPSTDTPSTGTEEASPADHSSGGGGIPDGAKAAFGIGALLGLGGLAEAGAFAGFFRRFRYRL